MKQTVMKKWAEALRSGEYTQGAGMLRTDDNEFCCLGVLCNLHAQEHPELASLEDDPEMYMGMTDFLPDEVMLWAGMKTAAGRLPVADEYTARTSLSHMNDIGVKFEKIAKVIEDNWAKL